jgi:hypothetical protein
LRRFEHRKRPLTLSTAFCIKKRASRMRCTSCALRLACYNSAPSTLSPWGGRSNGTHFLSLLSLCGTEKWKNLWTCCLPTSTLPDQCRELELPHSLCSSCVSCAEHRVSMILSADGQRVQDDRAGTDHEVHGCWHVDAVSHAMSGAMSSGTCESFMRSTVRGHAERCAGHAHHHARLQCLPRLECKAA